MTRRLASAVGLAALAVAVLLCGFPPGAPGAPWTVLAALTAAGCGFLAPGRLCPIVLAAAAVSGGLGWMLGAGGPRPWPVVLILAFAAGERFRAALAPPSPRPEPNAGPLLRALAWLWTIGALAAIASARTLWAAARGLWGRVVNVQGLTDVDVARQAIVSLAVVLAGIALFGILARVDERQRRIAVSALLAGAAVSGGVAVLQAWGFLAAPRSGFWRFTGRFQGLATDPNALGILLGLCLPPAIAGVLGAPGLARRFVWVAAAAATAGGLFASGSRSGLIVAAAGLLALFRPRGRAGRVKSALAALGVLAVLGAALLLGGRGRGNLGHRLLESFDRDVPLAGRASSRPLLWKEALIAWERHPVAGIGWNAFSWRLPNLAAETGVSLPGYDNPGNFYLQAFCETGVVGGALVLIFAVGSGRRALAAARRGAREGDRRLAASAGAVLGFLAALLVGSHLLAPEGAVAFFALLALVAPPGLVRSRIASKPILAGTVLLAALAWISAVGASRTAASAFRYSSRVGIYGEEPSPAGTFRWTRRRAAWRMEAGEKHRLLLVVPVSAEHPADVEIRALGRRLWAGRLWRRDAATLAIESSPERPTIFFFDCSFGFVPGAAGGTADDRQLSMQMFELPGRGVPST